MASALAEWPDGRHRVRADPGTARPDSRSVGGGIRRSTGSRQAVTSRYTAGSWRDVHGVGPGDLVVVLEAMKMENPVTAHRAGTITRLNAVAGNSVSQGTVLCEIKD
jgi:acetyl-CoA/propionyl-CoA carboxylase biotin carboxyl carrier protein